MKVKQIISNAAVHLLREDIKKYCEGEALADAEKDVEELLSYYNEVEKEIATDFFPLYRERWFFSDTGKIAFESFGDAPCSIKAIKSENGDRLSYDFYGRYLKTKKGKVKIVYSYYPCDKTLEDDTESFFGLSSLPFIAGIIKNYYLSRGLLNESAVWNRTFYESLSVAQSNKKGALYAESRRWI